MRKAFFTALLTAVLLAVCTTPAVAAKPPRELNVARLAAAKNRFVDHGVSEFRIGLKILNNRELSPEQIDQLKAIFGKWVDERLVPFLIRNDILDDWIDIQFDPDVLRLHREALEATTLGDALKIAQECDDLARKRWPKVVSKISTPEWRQLHQSLQVSMMRILEEK